MRLTDVQIREILYDYYLSEAVGAFPSQYLAHDPEAEIKALELLIEEGFIDEDAILEELETEDDEGYD